MTKLFQALFTGIFITFILDFFIFLGVKQNYIDLYEIDLYYNILFADNQNIYIFSFVAILLGFIVSYLNKTKVSISLIGLFFVLALSTLIPAIGEYLGKDMFMSTNVELRANKHVYIGDIYYDGRTHITFFDKELEKMIVLNKKDITK